MSKLKIIKNVSKTPCYCCTDGLCGKARPRKSCPGCKGTGKYNETHYLHIVTDNKGNKIAIDGDTVK
jgi:hypothetical protein